MRVLLAVATLVVVAGAASVSLEEMEFHVWKLKFGKSYGSVEDESQRKMIWLDNRKLVLEHNLLADQGLRSYRLGMNHFADMDNQEYQAMLKGCLNPVNITETRSAAPFLEGAGNTDLPSVMDWRKKGCVTEVKNQASCGSCWAFSAVGALECQMFQKTNQLVSLSEQQLVDCAFTTGNNGCSGGRAENAFLYVMYNGLQTEESYPYEKKAKKCRADSNKIKATCKDFRILPSGSDGFLQYAVAKIGPVSVAIDTSRYTFQLYESGVYDDPFCSSTALDHAVLLVGYNIEGYWVIKNRMRVLLAVAALVVVAGAASVSLEDLEFHAWKLKFGKSYVSGEDESRRKMIWLDNRKLVLEHNLLADQGLKSYRLGMNHFADMDNQEYQAKFARCLKSSNRTRSRSTPALLRQAEGATVPHTVEWTEQGYVTEVKNQGECGSCWAFSTVGALEGQMFRKTGKLVPLSEQQLVDCSWLYENGGCEGGLMDKAFQYVMENGGLMAESSYPYEETEGMCRYKSKEVVAGCRGFEMLPSGDENTLQLTLAAVGPVSVAIDAGQNTFQLYESGVYDDPYCNNMDLNHAVLVVGYSTDIQGQDYWLVKNSWGTDWGDEGYIKMSRNKRNQCGIASYAVYPEV
ncbi:hypothetical protein NFI96_023250 [Prochilodus magdalenae]|nr:hypothetical protein NFI96_023250 [Prochilodus magdalenae]